MAQTQNTDKVVGTVRRTENLEAFKTLTGNRELGGRPAKIIKSIQQNGYISSPITVNEKMEVIDGQGRLAALKALSLPVEYYVVKGAGIKECIALNAQTTPWRTQDYIDSFVTLGNENYLRLDKLIKKHKVTPKTAAQIAAGLYGSGHKNPKVGTAAIKNGDLEVSDTQYHKADETLTFISLFTPTLKKVGGSLEYWALALSFCYRLKEIDKIRLQKQVEKMSPDMHGCSSIEAALKELEAVYNYKCHNKIYIYTEYSKMLCEAYKGYREKWAKKKIK